MNTIFDTIICTVGSGGTYAGLCLSNKINHYGKRIIGISISQPAEVFRKDIIAISKEFYTYRREHNALDPQDIHIIDGAARQAMLDEAAEKTTAKLTALLAQS